jgi:uncharacterized membrane protein YjfL (UPF0719 family)
MMYRSNIVSLIALLGIITLDLDSMRDASVGAKFIAPLLGMDATAWQSGLTGGVNGLVFALIVLFISLPLLNRLTPYSLSRELLREDNPALGLTAASYLFGCLLIGLGAFSGPATAETASGRWMVAMDFTYALAGMLLLNVTRMAFDRFAITELSLKRAIIEDRSLAAAAVEAGSYLSAALILGAAVSGEGGGPGSALLAYASALVLQYSAVKVYDLLTPFSIDVELTQGNIAVGISLAGWCIASGLIGARAVAGDYHGVSALLASLAYYITICLPLLIVVRSAINLSLCRGHDHDLNSEISIDRNCAAAFIEAAALVAITLVLICSF